MAPSQMTTRIGPHPMHAILLGFPIALFSSALASDIAYLQTAEIQWTNFSSWLISGALFFGGLVLCWALISLGFGWHRADRDRRMIYAIVLAAMCGSGLVNILKHSMDGWSSVGTLGLVLSVVCTILALLAGWIGYSALAREVQQ